MKAAIERAHGRTATIVEVYICCETNQKCSVCCWRGEHTHDRPGTQPLQNQDVQTTAGFSENLNVPSMKKELILRAKHKNRQAGNVPAQGTIIV